MKYKDGSLKTLCRCMTLHIQHIHTIFQDEVNIYKSSVKTVVFRFRLSVISKIP